MGWKKSSLEVKRARSYDFDVAWITFVNIRIISNGDKMTGEKKDYKPGNQTFNEEGSTKMKVFYFSV